MAIIQPHINHSTGANIVRNFYCLLVTKELAQGSKKDTAINRVQGDDKTFCYLSFLLMVFSIITTHATQELGSPQRYVY